VSSNSKFDAFIFVVWRFLHLMFAVVVSCIFVCSSECEVFFAVLYCGKRLRVLICFDEVTGFVRADKLVSSSNFDV
jgi:hypothetical protein